MKFSRLFLMIATLLLCAALTISLGACDKTKNCEHDYYGGETLAPQCEMDGMRIYFCALCGHSYTETIPATGHSYVEGKCACGAVDPVEHRPLRACSFLLVNLLRSTRI